MSRKLRESNSAKRRRISVRCRHSVSVKAMRWLSSRRDELVGLAELLMAGLEAHLSLLRVTLQTWVRACALSITRQVISHETCSCITMKNLSSRVAC